MAVREEMQSLQRQPQKEKRLAKAAYYAKSVSILLAENERAEEKVRKQVQKADKCNRWGAAYLFNRIVLPSSRDFIEKWE